MKNDITENIPFQNTLGITEETSYQYEALYKVMQLFYRYHESDLGTLSDKLFKTYNGLMGHDQAYKDVIDSQEKLDKILEAIDIVDKEYGYKESK